MRQELILETLNELIPTLRKPKPDDKPADTIATDFENLTLNVSAYPKQLAQINESVISIKNDPDYVQVSQSKFEINKNYMELITRYLAKETSTRA